MGMSYGAHSPAAIRQNPTVVQALHSQQFAFAEEWVHYSAERHAVIHPRGAALDPSGRVGPLAGTACRAPAKGRQAITQWLQGM